MRRTSSTTVRPPVERPAEADQYDDPQIGVETQIVPPPPYNDGAAGNGEVHADGNGVDEDRDDRYLERAPPGDHRGARAQGDPISDFLDNKEERGGGWFGRRK